MVFCYCFVFYGLKTCHAYYIAETLLTSISTSAYYIGRYPNAATVMYASTIFCRDIASVMGDSYALKA